MAEPAQHKVRTAIDRVAWPIALLLIVAALGWLAHWQVTQRLDEAADARVATIANGRPIAQWDLTNADDVIAGRVFGNADTRFDADGLHISSRGQAVEFGLRLSEPLDLARYGLVDLAVDAGPDVRFQWSAYFQDSTSPCRSEPQPVVEGHLRSQLFRIDWACALPPRPAAVSLRLVVDAPARTTVTLRDLRLLPIGIQIPPLEDDIPVVRTTSDISVAAARLMAMPNTIQPVAIVALGWRDAAGLQRRASLRELVPGVVTATSPNLRVNQIPKAETTDPWTFCIFGFLLLAWLSPPRSLHWRIPVQIGAALLMPLWLSVGLRMGTPFSGIDQAFLLAGAIYLAARLMDSALPWRWFGQPSAWKIPAASIAMTIALALLLHRNFESIHLEPITALRYFGWAAIQQLIMSRVVADRLAAWGWSVPWVSLGTATAFALLHAPNQSLMMLTLLGGLLWTWNWQRHRALLPNVVAHAICGLIATSFIDPGWLWSAEIGSRFLVG